MAGVGTSKQFPEVLTVVDQRIVRHASFIFQRPSYQANANLGSGVR